MQLSRLQPAYASKGPFLTVYLEPGQAGFDSAKEVPTRWRDLETQARSDGADEATIEAVAIRVAELQTGEVARDGVVLVAAEGEIRLEERLLGPVGGDHAAWARVPDLGPYVRANSGHRRLVMAVIDRTGADVYVRDGAALSHHELTGETWPIHKIRRAGWAQRRIESTVEETADRNARLVVDELVRLIGEVKPAVVLLAGEVEAREDVRDRMPSHLGDLVASTDRGSRNESDWELLERAMGETEWRAERQAQRDLLERFRTRLAHGLAVEGLAEVSRAFRFSAVEALIIAVENSDAGTVGETLRGTLAVGPEPTQLAPSVEELRRELTDSGADPGHDLHITEELAEAALVRAASSTDASFEVVTTSAAGLADGVGALLRFELPPSSS